MSQTPVAHEKPKIENGLKGIYVAETSLSDVNGTEGILTVKGYNVDELAFNASFEEAVYLLIYGKRLSSQELVTYKQRLAQYRVIPNITLEVIKTLVQSKVGPTETLQAALGTLFIESSKAKDDMNVLIIGSIPTIVAYYYRLLHQQTIIAPQVGLGHIENFLYMLRGTKPDPKYTKALEIYCLTVMDHGMNASTFVSRCIVSSGSDLLSAVIGAVGSLKGPKHGGAPGPALKLTLELSKSENPEQYIRNLIISGEKIPGFGHRIYKTRDPRANVLKKAGKQFYTGEEEKLSQIFSQTEQLVLKLLQELKPGRELHTNVEFYTAYLLHGIGIEEELFTSLFAMSRVVGWLAHAREQIAADLIFRPESYYNGKYGEKWDT